jgi:hypothetical protein
MHRCLFVAAALIVALPSSQALAVTAKQKAAICKFGADDQKLAGKARSVFIAKCMSNKNDPRGGAPGSSGPPGAAGAGPPPKN